MHEAKDRKVALRKRGAARKEVKVQMSTMSFVVLLTLTRNGAAKDIPHTVSNNRNAHQHQQLCC